jgi:putative SOS response-associated peptidase YedK
MCGRYQRRSDKQRVAEAFGLGNVDGLFLELAPDYNAAPGRMHPMVVWDQREGMRTLQMIHWRLLPSFVADPKKFRLNTTNAHADRLLKSSVWKESFLRCRCLLPADSFVEWQR